MQTADHGASKKIQLSLGVDFDSVSGWIGSYGGQDSPADIQRGVFAAEIGVPRLLELFRRRGIQTTWFIPGHSIESFPSQSAAIVDHGHEIGAHGYTHENPISMNADQEEEVLAFSSELITRLTGKAPRGYVAPWWEMSERTPELLLKYGFDYDHSQAYGDFQPHYVRTGDAWTNIDYERPASSWMKPMHLGDAIDLVEIPTNWYLDDLPPMMFIKSSPNSHGFVSPHDIEKLWRDQFEWVHRELDYAVFPITIHPDVCGRPQNLLMLERFFDFVDEHSGVEWTTMEAIAVEYRERVPFRAQAS
ncbi:MAG: polysaccharide deacetylase [Rhodoglobus sp.]|nr:polysaccharide deacetylase [Rhodoglobus sp.]